MVGADLHSELLRNGMLVPRVQLSSCSPMAQMMHELEEEMNALTRAFGLPTLASPQEQHQSLPLRALACDVLDKGDHFEVSDVPGMTDKDIKVTVSPDNVLQISGERKIEKEEGKEGEGIWRMERSYGSFVRRFRLPDNVDPEGIKAQVNNGVLSLSVPKVVLPKPKTIQIEVASGANPEAQQGEAADPAAPVPTQLNSTGVEGAAAAEPEGEPAGEPAAEA